MPNEFHVPLTHPNIQAAINALPASGGVVRLGPGIWSGNVTCNKPVVIEGCNPPGPCWTPGSTPVCSIEAASGVVISLGGADKIYDPCVLISRVAIRNPDTGKCTAGIHAGRYRNLTLRDVQFSNFQPTGCALILDGTSTDPVNPGWHEWAHLDNVWFANCFQAINAINATDITVVGGGVLNVDLTAIPGSIGLQTTGTSDTLRVHGWATLEVASPIILNGSPWEYAQIFGLRAEAHTGDCIGVQVNTANNLIMGSYYGVKTALSFSPASSSNRYLAGMWGGVTGTPVVDAGVNNTVI